MKNIIKENQYGIELVLDLIDCNPETIRSDKHIRKYAKEICEVIDMKPFGEPFVERFGLGVDFTTGYSLVQLIETSSITGHFSELWNRAYINIFSCKKFNEQVAAEFTKKHFGAKELKQNLLIRD